MTEPTDALFDEWLTYIFERYADECEGERAYTGLYPWEEDPDPTLEITFVARLFASPIEYSQPYSDPQISRALYWLINALETPLHRLFDDSFALAVGEPLVRDMVSVFRDLFAPRCSPILSTSPLPAGAAPLNPLNNVCYMWWDISPFYGKSGQPNRERYDRACLDVMRQTLQLDSIACQEAALHGLGHWKRAYPDEVQATIDAFLTQNDLNADLRAYAHAARAGRVL